MTDNSSKVLLSSHWKVLLSNQTRHFAETTEIISKIIWPRFHSGMPHLSKRVQESVSSHFPTTAGLPKLTGLWRGGNIMKTPIDLLPAQPHCSSSHWIRCADQQTLEGNKDAFFILFLSFVSQNTFSVLFHFAQHSLTALVQGTPLLGVFWAVLVQKTQAKHRNWQKCKKMIRNVEMHCRKP